MTTPSNAQMQDQQKIAAAKKNCEDSNGIREGEDRIQEWALLDICEHLIRIHFQLATANAPKPGGGGAVD